MVYNSAKSAVTVTAEYASASLKASDYESSVVTITAAARTKALNIEGNTRANRIIGTSANDTLNGAAGNDTLTGGDGSDVFIYDSKGSDVVTDYVAGEDALKLTSGTVSAYSISGSDATFKVGSGTVKISGGKTKAITVVDSKNKTRTYDGGLIYDGDVAKGKALTVTAAYSSNTLASYGASVVTIDSSARTKALNIVGNAEANVITGTDGNDTIDGGAGNDTLTGGKGKDIFVYESGDGNDLVYDYTAGQDTIKISGGEVSDYSLSGSDAVLRVGSGSLKVKGGKSAAVLVVDDNKKVSLYQGGAIYNAASSTKATAATLTSAYGNTFTAGTSMISVDASERKDTINIVGSAKNNFLVGGAGKDIIDGGKGNDSISGGKGSDILTGGAGSDVFIYANGDGTDAITDYVSGEDVIKLTSGEVKSYSVKNGDAILKVGSGAITLKGAGNNAVSVLDADDVLTVYNGGLIYNNPKISRADVVTITADYDGEFNSYGASVETIDASARTKAIEITGNGADNFILGGKGKDTIDAGKGNDTLIGCKGNDLLTGGKGNDVFFYATGDGNDTITDYGTGSDIISVSGSVSYSTKNGDAVLKIGSGNITLKDAASAAVTVVSDNVASIYSGSGVSTKTWTGISSSSGGETVKVTETVEVEVTLPAETVTVEAEPVTITVGGEDTVTVEVTLPAVTLPAETVTVEAESVTITVGGGGGSLITGTTGNDTLYGTVGNDTLTGGEGADIFIYEGTGDFDIITDYGAGADTISIGANAISGGMAVGNDVLMAIGSGVIKILGAKNKAVSIAGSSGASVYSNGVFVEESISPNGVTVTLDADFPWAGNFNLETYNETATLKAVNVDASAVRNWIEIHGDDEANIIWAGKSSGYIYVGEGDDTIHCGAGDDFIYYEKYGGSDVIYNFLTGDRLNFGTNDADVTFNNILLSGNDIIFNVESGDTVTLKDAKNQRIATSYSGMDSTFGLVTISGGTATLDSDYLGNFDVAHYAESITNIDASAVKEGVNLYGNDSANVIRAGREGGSIFGGEGNDTIYCGNGEDQIHYGKFSGNYVIYNFRTDDQIIFDAEATDANFDNLSFSGNDVILNLLSGNTITLKDAKDQRIDFWGRREDWWYYDYNSTLGKVTISGGTATLDSNYLGDFKATYYAESVKNVNASAVKAAVDIYGDDSANIIYAGREGGSIYAGEGNDTIYCGRGNDTIHRESYGGSDVIYNFQTGDYIYHTPGGDGSDFKNISLSGNDVIINLNSDEKITLKDAKDQRIHFYQYYYIDLNATLGKVTISGGSATLASDYTGSFDMTNYAASIKNIDASAVKEAVNLYGDNSANVIYAGRAGGEIDAGKGNDTIYCGRAEDYIYHEQSSGNDVIYDISANDNIQLWYCDAENVSVKGSDVIITTDYDDTITVKNASSVNFQINSRSWQEYTSNGNAAVPWFAEDDTNFTNASDLDSIIDETSAITSLNFSATNPAEIFAPELTFTGEK